ncbi:protein FAM228B-like isoform X1 [Lithobates pipiens]
MTSPRSEMMSTCRGMLKEGVITMQTSHLPKDLLPAPEHAKAVTFRKSSPNEDGSFLPKKVFPSRPGTRSLSTTSLRKTEDWLAYKPYVQLIMDAENEKISAKTQCVLDAENHYNQCLDKYVKQAECADLRRKEIQHKRWTERVAEPLQKTIERYIDSQTSEDIERRRRWLLEQYLEYCNKKGSAFMRDYDSSEYDPFINRLCKHYLRVSTPVFKDPLLQQYQKRYEEEKVALHCDTGRLYSANEVNELNLQKLPQAPLGRQTMNGIKWLKTPFGYIESDIRVKSRQRVRGSVNQGTLDFKTWADTKYPPEIFNTERNICHKRKFSVNTSSMPAYSKQWGPDHTVTMIKI